MILILSVDCLGEWSLDKKCGRGVMVWKDVDEMYLGMHMTVGPSCVYVSVCAYACYLSIYYEV